MIGGCSSPWQRPSLKDREREELDVAAHVLTLILSALFTTDAASGGARHVYHLYSKPPPKSLVRNLNWISRVFSISGIEVSIA